MLSFHDFRAQGEAPRTNRTFGTDGEAGLVPGLSILRSMVLVRLYHDGPDHPELIVKRADVVIDARRCEREAG